MRNGVVCIAASVLPLAVAIDQGLMSVVWVKENSHSNAEVHSNDHAKGESL